MSSPGSGGGIDLSPVPPVVGGSADPVPADPISTSSPDLSISTVGDTSEGGSGGGGAVSLTPQQLHAEIFDDINNGRLSEAYNKISRYDDLMARDLLEIENAGRPLPANFVRDYVDPNRLLQQEIRSTRSDLSNLLAGNRYFMQQMQAGRLSAGDIASLSAKASAAPARTAAPARPVTPTAPLATVPASVTASPTATPAPDDEISTEADNKKPQKPFAPEPLNIFTDSMGNPLTTIGAVLAQMPKLMLFSMFNHAFIVRPVSVLLAAGLGMGSTILGVGAKGIGLLGVGFGMFLDLVSTDKTHAERYKNSYFNKVGDNLLTYGKSTDRTLNAALHLTGTVLSLTGLVFAYPINAVRFNRYNPLSSAYKREQDHLSAFKATLSDDTKDPLKSLKAAIDADNLKYPTPTDKAAAYAKAKANEIKQGMAKERQEYRKKNYKWTTTMEGALKYNATELYGDSFNNVINNAICLFMPMHVRNGIALGIELALGAAALPFALITGSISAFANKFGIKGPNMDAFNDNLTGPINGFLINRFMGALCRIGEIVGNPLVGLMPSALGDGARRIMIGTFYRNHNDGETNSNIASRVLFGYEEGQALTDKMMRYAPDKYVLVRTLEHTPNRMINLVFSPVFLPLGVLSGAMNLMFRPFRGLAKLMGLNTPKLDSAIKFSGNLTGSLIVDTVGGIIFGDTKHRQYNLGVDASAAVIAAAGRGFVNMSSEGIGKALGRANAHLVSGDTSLEQPVPTLSVPASTAESLAGTTATPTNVPVPGSSTRVGDAVSASANVGPTQTNEGAITGGVVQRPYAPAIVSSVEIRPPVQRTESQSSFRSETEERANKVTQSFARNIGAMAYRAITLTGTRRALGLTTARRIEPSPSLDFVRSGGAPTENPKPLSTPDGANLVQAAGGVVSAIVKTFSS